MTTVDRILEEVRQLSPEELAEFRTRFEGMVEPDLDAAWVRAWSDELDRRESAEGSETGTPWETVRERMWQRLRGTRS